MPLYNWFLPHKETHKKARLISWEALLVYVLLFILLQVGFSIISYSKPGVLGITANIDQKKLIELTNIERQKKGLSPVSENEALDKAAKLKAENMFAENYWAHFSPSGKTPWDFILGTGYHFTFAGENLAKNFYSSDEIVTAWMNSPTHRDNLLNSNYKDIGIAVIEGNLNGQKTTLIVQEFGTTEAVVSKPSVNIQGKNVSVPTEDIINKPQLKFVTSEVKLNAKTIFDPYLVSKVAGFSVITFVIVLLALDIWVLRKRRVFRLSSHNIAHMTLLSLAAGGLLLSSPGVIL
ncbi:hypothetical protein HYW41_01635 [Candidatus Daviesbacteria bacterium]|nr:hypothetical protein [Candidatus Daviesbacteria bacterium]